MPAPNPSITAMTEANAGRSSGAASAVSRIWPTATPSSAPISVEAIALGAVGRGEQRLAVRLLEVGRVGRVAHVDRGEPPVAGPLRVLRERIRDGVHALERPDLAERLLDRGPVLLERALVDAEDERRVRAREGGAVRTEQVERLLGLRAGDLEVVG